MLWIGSSAPLLPLPVYHRGGHLSDRQCSAGIRAVANQKEPFGECLLPGWISLGYLWDIFGISRLIPWRNLGDILGMTLGYLWYIFGISWGYLGDIFKVIEVINWAIVHWFIGPLV